MLALIALVLFALAAFGVTFHEINIVALGLAFLAGHLVVGGYLASMVNLPWRRTPPP